MLQKQEKKKGTINENLGFLSGKSGTGGSWFHAAQQLSLLRWDRGEW